MHSREPFINSTATDCNRLWKFDFAVPRKFEIGQKLGEERGPGGLFFKVRPLPQVFDSARDIEELCLDVLRRRDEG
jgi:alpha-galactosidase